MHSWTRATISVASTRSTRCYDSCLTRALGCSTSSSKQASRNISTPRRYSRDNGNGSLKAKSDVVFGINATIVNVESRVRLADTPNAFLQFDDARIAAEAESLDFLKFESIKLTNRTQF